MKQTHLLALAVVLVTGCKNGDGDGTAFGKAAEPFGPLAKVSFGMQDTEVVKKAPEFEFYGMSGAARVGKDTDFKLELVSTMKVIDTMKMIGEKHTLAELEKAWGPGKKGKGILNKEAVFWTNASATIRAEAQQDPDLGLMLEFKPLLPLAKLISADATTVGGIKLLGSTTDEVWKAQIAKHMDAERAQLKLPVWEWGRSHTLVMFTERDGAIASYSVALSTEGSPTAKDEIIATLEKQFGKPTHGKDELGDERWVFKADKPTVEIRQGDDTLFVEVEQ